MQKKQFGSTFLGLVNVEDGKADDLLKALKKLTNLFN